MEKIIIIRYSEIFLKGANRSFFENALSSNIKHALAEKTFIMEKTCGRYIIRNFSQDDESYFLDRLQNIFGIHSFSVGYEVDSDIDLMYKAAKLLCEPTGTFKIETHRADKNFPLHSYDVSSEIGYRLLNEYPEMTVDVHNPNQKIFFDIRENGKTLVFCKVIKAVNGMPVGVSGKGLILLSGGIDSPVACFMMAKRGMSLRALHFASYPYTSAAAKEKVLTLAKLLTKYCIHLTVDIVSFTEIQTQIHEKCPESYMISIMRRFMMRIANEICKKNNLGAIVTGESLGQVASQTLESITSTNSVAKYPVLRPLIGFDKDEIIEISRKIGTFETSILPYEDCCTIFLPKNPVTRPKLDTICRIESVLDVDFLVNDALNKIETIHL